MVYESDFYTTRRTRPTVSSYSVTVPPRYVFRRSMSPVPSYTTTYAIPRFTRAYSPVVISVSRLRSFPSFAIYSAPIRRPRATSPLLNYKRIVQVPIVSSRVGRNAAYLAEMNRIGHRLRPRVGSEPCEDFLNSKAIVSFDDETRAIRARTKELLRRVNEPIPRSYYPDYQPPRELEYTPEPLSHDEYIEQRVFSPMRHVHQDISTMSRFNEPARQYIGKGHLACISFAGGRPMDRRRAMPRCEEDRNVRDDIKFLSHYNRARAAAVGPVASLDAIKALLAPPYHRRDPQPELMVMPYSRPRAPASFLFRMEAAERDKKGPVEKKFQREIRPYVTSKSKDLARLRLTTERDAELGRTAFAESQQATKAAREARGGDDPDELERIARKKQREMEMEEAARHEVEEKRAEREVAKRQADLEHQRELEREERERQEAEAAERKRQAELERKAEQERRAEEARLEAERQAELDREEAERQAEEEQLAELERQAEAEQKAEQDRIAAARKAEEERQAAELARQEAEKKAEEERLEAERKAEEARQEAEKKAEEERLAELARQEAEKKAEEERLEAERKAEEEKQAAEVAAAAEAAAAEAPASEEAAPAESEAEPAATEPEVTTEEAAPAESEPAAQEEAPSAEESAPAAEEPSEATVEEPVVEEPQSPAEDVPMTNGAVVNGTSIEELEIPLEDETPEAVVKKVQEVSQSDEAEPVEA